MGESPLVDTHLVREGARFVPAAESEFARDPTFGYRAATLPEWVEEKTAGRWVAGKVARVTLDDIRVGGEERVAAILDDVQGGQPVVVNALDYPDLWTLVLALEQVESAGKVFVYRTGASFVRARAGIRARPLLSRAELLSPIAERASGLVVVGSHVQRGNEQLSRLLELPGVTGIEVDAGTLLTDAGSRAREIARVADRMNVSLAARETPLVYTSRAIARPSESDELHVARAVSEALVAIVRKLDGRPDFVIGKGGITSSDVGTRGLGAERSMVLGQVRPGVPVWQVGKESRFPGLSYVVFPGNVGGPETLAEIVAELIGQ